MTLSEKHTFRNPTVTLPIARFAAPRFLGTDAKARDIDSNRLVASCLTSAANS